MKIETGEVVQTKPLGAEYFGEGITDWKGSLIQITWQSEIGFVYDLNTFEQTRTWNYKGQGWGLTHDDTRVIMSDGSSSLRFLDPATLKETGRIVVRAFATPSEVAALAEPVVVNCTGLGARDLFGDPELVPIKGQLTVLLPQPEVDYALATRDLYMFPRSDGILLGGTHERGVETLEPDLPIAAETVPGLFAMGWTALVAPKGTPPAVVQQLTDDLRKVTESTETNDRLQRVGVMPFRPIFAADLARFIEGEQKLWRPIVEAEQLK